MDHQGPRLFLPDDIVLLIIEQIHDNALAPLTELCLVSHQFARLATPILYRSTELVSAQLRGEDDQRPVPRCPYSSRSNVIAYAREVIIQTPLNWELVTDLLSRMKHLKSVRWRHWDESFPNSIRHLLSTQWPDCKLHIEDLPVGDLRPYEFDEPDQDLRILDHLLGCRNIHSITADPHFPRRKLATLFKELLISCPKLETLRINHFTGVHLLGLRPGDRLPPVKELILEISGKHSGPIDFWNLTRVRHLEIRGKSALPFFYQLRDYPNCIETLIVEQNYIGFLYGNCEALTKFISSAKGIQNLTIILDFFIVPMHIIRLHGNTLRSLSIYRPRVRASLVHLPTDLPYYSPDDFKMLNHHCPHLSSITMDIIFPEPRYYLTTRNSTHPETFLTTLTQFPNLNSLHLLGRFNERRTHNTFEYSKKYPHPHIKTDTQTIHHIFSYLHHYKIGAKFESLSATFGEHTSKDIPPTRYYAPEFNENCDRPTTLFTCNIGDKGEIVVESRCVDSSCEGNPAFDCYFKDENLTDERPGYVYLEDWMEFNEAGGEADLVMAGFQYGGSGGVDGGSVDEGDEDEGSEDEGSEDEGSEDEGSEDEGSVDEGDDDEGDEDEGDEDEGDEDEGDEDEESEGDEDEGDVGGEGVSG